MALFLEKKLKLVEIIGPVLLCYGIGLLLGNVGIYWPNDFIKENISSIAVPFAIPLLMFESNPRLWFEVAGKALLSFFLGVVAVVLAVIIAFLLVGQNMPEAREMGAMLSGVYTGGTPNLVAIGQALQVGTETIPVLTIMDTVLCAIYLLFLLTISQKVLGLFLPATVVENIVEKVEENKNGNKTGILLAFLASAACLLSGLMLSWLFTGGIKDELIIMLSLTSVAFLASFSIKINNLKGSYKLGEFLILVFCVAIGMLSDFSILKNQSLEVFTFCAIIVGGTLLIHFFLAFLFKIDVHTVLITSTAALFGPAFVGLVATRLKNRAIITTGMTTGVIGYAIAFFVGLLVYNILLLL